LTRVLIRASVAVVYLAALIAAVHLTGPMAEGQDGVVAGDEAVVVAAAPSEPVAVDEAPLATLAVAAGLVGLAGSGVLASVARRRLAERVARRTVRVDGVRGVERQRNRRALPTG
jgi:hypothetical protein